MNDTKQDRATSRRGENVPVGIDAEPERAGQSGAPGKAPPDDTAPSGGLAGGIEGYCFTLGGAITQTFIGEIPGGFRFDLQYGPDEPLSFDFPSALSPEERVIEGAELLTGTDWVSVSATGIVTFDTRVTLQVRHYGGDEQDDERCLISLNLNGRVDLADTRKDSGQLLFSGKNRAEIISAWQKGFEAKSYLPLALSAVFDVPVQGDTKKQGAIYKQCRALESQLFIAYGRATYLAAPNSPLDVIRLDFVRPKPPVRSLEAKREKGKPRAEAAPLVAVHDPGSSDGAAGGTS